MSIRGRPRPGAAAVSKGQLTRERIAAAARAMLVGEGYESFAVRKIAAAAGLGGPAAGRSACTVMVVGRRRATAEF